MISIERLDGRQLNLPWNVMDELLEIIMQITGMDNDEASNLLNEPISNEIASKIYAALKDAIDSKKIGTNLSNTDPMGRTHDEPDLVMVVGGSGPLNANQSGILNYALNFFSNKPAYPGPDELAQGIA